MCISVVKEESCLHGTLYKKTFVVKQHKEYIDINDSICNRNTFSKMNIAVLRLC